jgi:5'-nucleotidase
MRLLIDMDQVLYDFVGGVNANLPPDIVPQTDPSIYWYFNLYPTEKRPALYSITNKPGFFYNLPLYKGAQKCVLNLAEMGYDIWLVSTPLRSNPQSTTEKIEAIVRDFGWAWADKLILTHDKTLIRGRILIDDKPDISGTAIPTWTQVYKDHAYNRDRGGYRIYNWDLVEVKYVLESVIEESILDERETY